MKSAPYVKGLVDLGSGLYAYLQPNGGWGWSNAGFVVDAGESLLVDTLFDEPLTAELLDRIRDATGTKPEDIGTIVNTHANGDHTHGNALCENAEIIASRASAQEMAETPPKLLAQLKAAGAELGAAGEFFAAIFAPFDFANVRGRAPTKTFDSELELHVGKKRIVLNNVGPAHTLGDVLVHVPDDRVVFTGDIVFADVTPIMWAGPIDNWLAACDHILSLDVDAIVPGHGPLADNRHVRRLQDYLRYIDSEAKRRFDAGLDSKQAALDIALADFDAWGDAERIAVNVETLYRSYRGDQSRGNPFESFALMAEIARARRR